MIGKLEKFFSYLWGKKEELADMDERDALLAKVVLDIHRKRTHSSFQFVPLFSVFPIHPINRKSARAATDARIMTLEQAKEDLLKIRNLSREVLNRHIPSVSAIKVVQTAEQRYVAYEGNGRLAALQTVFSPDDAIEIEIERYHFKDDRSILRRINRVRRLHDLAGN